MRKWSRYAAQNTRTTENYSAGDQPRFVQEVDESSLAYVRIESLRDQEPWERNGGHSVESREILQMWALRNPKQSYNNPDDVSPSIIALQAPGRDLAEGLRQDYFPTQDDETLQRGHAKNQVHNLTNNPAR